MIDQVNNFFCTEIFQFVSYVVLVLSPLHVNTCFLQFLWIVSFWVCNSSSKKKNVSKFDVSIDEPWRFRYMYMWLIEKTDSKIEVTSFATKLHPVFFHKLRQQIDTDLRERSKSQSSDLSWGMCRLWSSKSSPNLELIFLSKDSMPHLRI